MLTHSTDVQGKHINCVRMYLGVNWISKLASIFLRDNIEKRSFESNNMYQADNSNNNNINFSI